MKKFFIKHIEKDFYIFVNKIAEKCEWTTKEKCTPFDDEKSADIYFNHPYIWPDAKIVIEDFQENPKSVEEIPTPIVDFPSEIAPYCEIPNYFEFEYFTDQNTANRMRKKRKIEISDPVDGLEQVGIALTERFEHSHVNIEFIGPNFDIYHYAKAQITKIMPHAIQFSLILTRPHRQPLKISQRFSIEQISSIPKELYVSFFQERYDHYSMLIQNRLDHDYYLNPGIAVCAYFPNAFSPQVQNNEINLPDWEP
jgi:hypothetical protein